MQMIQICLKKHKEGILHKKTVTASGPTLSLAQHDIQTNSPHHIFIMKYACACRTDLSKWTDTTNKMQDTSEWPHQCCHTCRIIVLPAFLLIRTFSFYLSVDPLCCRSQLHLLVQSNEKKEHRLLNNYDLMMKNTTEIHLLY